MNFYLLFKSLHLISVISWMAGLLYLPRIFVYHAQNSSEKKTSEIFKTMERKLFFYIMTPAMILSWIFGVILIHSIGFQQIGQTWMILKIILVIFLTLYHFYLGKIVAQFNDVMISWDGNYEGEALPAGTYYYILQLGNGVDQNGPITIVR